MGSGEGEGLWKGVLGEEGLRDALGDALGGLERAREACKEAKDELDEWKKGAPGRAEKREKRANVAGGGEGGGSVMPNPSSHTSNESAQAAPIRRVQIDDGGRAEKRAERRAEGRAEKRVERRAAAVSCESSGFTGNRYTLKNRYSSVRSSAGRTARTGESYTKGLY